MRLARPAAGMTTQIFELMSSEIVKRIPSKIEYRQQPAVLGTRSANEASCVVGLATAG
jgi:hypothetical protein